MKQQYILLRKENDLLNSLIGQSFNQRSKFEADKILNEIHSKAESRFIGKSVLCYVHDKGEIKGVGGSSLLQNKKTGEIISNLILDNFGEILSGYPTLVGTSARLIFANDTGGASRGFNIRNPFATYLNTALSGLGWQLRIGSGSTPPVRTDFNIETPFGTAPESGFFAITSNGIYNSGLGNIKYFGGIGAGGAGTISESTTTGVLRDQFGTGRLIQLFRDIISPSVSFILAQSIVLEYTIQL